MASGHTPHWSESKSPHLFTSDRNRIPSDCNYDCRQAAAQMMCWLKEKENAEYDPVEAHRVLEVFADDKLTRELCRIMWLHDLTPGALAEAFQDAILDGELQETLK